jgi:hypothetical protein
LDETGSKSIRFHGNFGLKLTFQLIKDRPGDLKRQTSLVATNVDVKGPAEAFPVSLGSMSSPCTPRKSLFSWQQIIDQPVDEVMVVAVEVSIAMPYPVADVTSVEGALAESLAFLIAFVVC